MMAQAWDQGPSKESNSIHFKDLSNFFLNHTNPKHFHNSAHFLTENNRNVGHKNENSAFRTISIASNSNDFEVISSAGIYEEERTEHIHPAQSLQNKIEMKQKFSNLHGNGSTPGYRLNLSNSNSGSNSTISKGNLKNTDANGKKKYSKGKETLTLKRFFQNHVRNEGLIDSLNRNLTISSVKSDASLNTIGSEKSGHMVASPVVTKISSLLSNSSYTSDSYEYSHTESEDEKYYGMLTTTNERTHELDFTPLTKRDNIKSIIAKFGRTIKKVGEGANGSVQVVRNDELKKLYAVKIFNSNELNNERNYTDNENDLSMTKRKFSQKITTEFCIGSTLHHQNVIQILGMAQKEDLGQYILIMEFSQHDFFDVVMSGNLLINSINCFFKQLCLAVDYLHHMGISHRDLKLDNCVVNSNGILKVIDFGCAVIFKNDLNEDTCSQAYGIVGSDPYLAPELLNTINNKISNGYYNPKAIDVWSIAIVYYCMIVKKFPWKAPKLMYNSFRLFCSIPQYHNDSIMGPYRILRFLPEESRNLLALMIKIDPLERISMSQILDDPWFKSLNYCQYDNLITNQLHSDHSHVLVTDPDYQFDY